MQYLKSFSFKFIKTFSSIEEEEKKRWIIELLIKIEFGKVYRNKKMLHIFFVYIELQQWFIIKLLIL